MPTIIDPPTFEPKIPEGFEVVTTGKPKTNDCALSWIIGGAEWRVIEIKAENRHWQQAEDRTPTAADYICLIRPIKKKTPTRKILFKTPGTYEISDVEFKDIRAFAQSHTVEATAIKFGITAEWIRQIISA